MSVEMVEASWLFTRGRESIRVERVSLFERSLRLIVSGPGYQRDAREFEDEGACTSHQSTFENRLTAQGFHLEDFADRRRLRDRRGAPRSGDRRR